MTFLRRSRAGAAAPGAQAERAPRLVLRFAVMTAASLGLAAATILVLMRHLNTAQAERTAARQASFLTDVILQDEPMYSIYTEEVEPVARNA